MNCTKEQEKIAHRIIDALSDSEEAAIVTEDSLRALAIVTGLVIGQANYTLEQRASLIGLMTINMVSASAPKEDEEGE